MRLEAWYQPRGSLFVFVPLKGFLVLALRARNWRWLLVLFPRSQVGFLVVYINLLTLPPVRSHRLVVITVKVPAGSASHGRQCWSSRLSLTLTVDTYITYDIWG